MKPLYRLSLPLTMLLSSVALQAQTPATIAEIEPDKLSYAVGYDIGMNLRRQGIDLQIEQVMQAIRDTHNEAEPSVPREEMQQILTTLNEELREKRMQELRELADENQAKSNEFLQKNRSKDGVVVLPSGVQYKVIQEGDGERPGPADTVQVHYRGSRMDGLEFDSSFARGKPETFEVDQVLQGWQEILPLMREGAEWRIYVPPELGFGLRGQPPVGPNEAVVFDLRLVSVGPQE
mgnify:CR=1 FL=1